MRKLSKVSFWSMVVSALLWLYSGYLWVNTSALFKDLQMPVHSFPSEEIAREWQSEVAATERWNARAQCGLKLFGYATLVLAFMAIGSYSIANIQSSRARKN
ncbi:MAG: hypothetical protein KDK30_03905 [Leptospiraceae bacterium]|nr:hypothetical protein [Leptospiraceae bacterium]